MNTLNPAMGPPTIRQPGQPPQTPQSAYLQQAMAQIGQQPVSSPAQAGLGLLSTALLQHAQDRGGQYGADGGNAQKNASSDVLAASMKAAGVPFQQGAALPTTQPGGLGGLMGLGRSAMGGLGGLFRGVG